MGAILGCDSQVDSGLKRANDLLYEHRFVEADRLYEKLLPQLGPASELTAPSQQKRLLILERLGRINSLYLRNYKRAIKYYSILVKDYSHTDAAFAARAAVAPRLYSPSPRRVFPPRRCSGRPVTRAPGACRAHADGYVPCKAAETLFE